MFCIWKYCFFEKSFGESFESARGACYLCVCVSMVMGSYLGINETKTQPAHTHTHLFGIWAVVRLHCVFWLASWLRPEKLIPFMKIVENAHAAMATSYVEIESTISNYTNTKNEVTFFYLFDSESRCTSQSNCIPNYLNSIEINFDFSIPWFSAFLPFPFFFSFHPFHPFHLIHSTLRYKTIG